ncbi:MAG: cardiolipin synthase [Planctomycetaceae bacterium]|nr:cardiolipin synthase [Planctomycetaceae bacterium]
MQILWEYLLDQWRFVTLASASVLLIEGLAILSVFHALKHVRTSQAAVAWTTGLLTLPFVSLPLYWVFARHRFEGYREAVREVGQRHEQSMSAVQRELMTERFARSAQKRTALEYVADILDTPVAGGNQFQLLVDGEAFFDAVFKTIESAERYLYLSFFIIRDDELGNRFADALIRRASEGVQVRLLYDEVGCIQLSGAYLERLRCGGVDVRAFDTRQGWVNRFQINFRNHRKLIVADGGDAVLGGLNIGNEYLGTAAGLPRWRDTGVLMKGPGARKVQAVFAGDYYWAARQDLPEADWRSEADVSCEDKGSHESNRPLQMDQQAAGGDTEEAIPISGSSGCRGSEGQVAICSTGPADLRPRATMMYVAAAAAARKRIWISTPYLVPDEPSQVALHMAKARGVDVRLLIPSEADHWGVYLAGFYYEEILAEAGIPVYRYSDGFMHQKCVLIDDDLVLIGSTNLDNRSLYLNFELMLASDDPKLVNNAAEMLQRDFITATHSNAPDKPIRPWLARVGTAVARLFSPLL